MKENKNVKYINLPIISKERIYIEQNENNKRLRILTAILVIISIIILLLCGYSMAKGIEEVIINSDAEIVEPILIIERDPKLNITALNNYGVYNFKIKNFNEQNEITEVNLKYYIEIVSDVDNSVKIELYRDDEKMELLGNKTDYIDVYKDNQQENKYKIKVSYNNENEKYDSDIMQKIIVKVHTEQVEG